MARREMSRRERFRFGELNQVALAEYAHLDTSQLKRTALPKQS